MILFKIECLKIPLETPSGICLEKIASVFGKQLINPLLLLWNSGKECLHAPFKVCWEKGVCEPYLTFIWKKNACITSLELVEKTVVMAFVWKRMLIKPLHDIFLEKSPCHPLCVYV